MANAFMWLLAPVAALAVNVFCQVLLCRLKLAGSLLKSLYLGFGAGLVSLMSIHIVAGLSDAEGCWQWIGYLLTNLIIYSSLGYCYFHFVNLGETARRIRLVRELQSSPGGLTYDQLLQRYNSDEITQVRLQRLLGAGQVVIKNGHYFIVGKMFLAILEIMVLLKILVLGKSSEFNK